MAEFISKVVSQLMDYSLVLMVRHAGYALWSDGYMKGLQDAVRKIKNTREGIQHRIDEAEMTEEFRVEPLVSSWMVQADAFIEEADELISRRKDAIRCVGLVANPKTRYLLGRKAKHGLDDIAAHLKDKEFERITYRPLSSGGIATASSSKGDIVALKSRHSMLANIMKVLGDDTTSRIGVYGDGGVGKSTLLDQVEREARLLKDFDEVVVEVVSQNPNFRKMEAKIQNVLEMVKLKAKKDDEDNDGEEKVNKRGVLIILDDLWKEFDLEKIGVGENEDKIKVKLLMTSRYRHVLVDKMDCRESFHLKALNEKEAWEVFESIVGDKVRNPGLKTTAEKLVEKCQGLPLLIDALGKQLQKTNSPRDWEGALEQLQGSDVVQKGLELSFKNLEDRQVGLLSIISGLDGRDGIQREALVRYAIGLGLWASSIDTVEATRAGIRALLDGLEADSLLRGCDANCVKVHDLVRDAIVSIVNQDRHALVLRVEEDFKDLKAKLRKSKAIFLPYPEIRDLPSIRKCQELEVFVAFADKDHLLQIPDSFFRFMPKLKVLGLSHACLNPIPSSIQYLKKLQTLCLDYCDMEDVSIVGQLVNLQVLSFFGSEITKLPKEVGELTDLKLLDLSHCSKLEVIERGALERLVCLEELRMEKSFVRWSIERDGHQNNSSLADLSGMPHLSNLDIVVPDVNMLLHKDLPFGKLDKYRIHIGDRWDWSGDYKESRTLKLNLECSCWIFAEEWFQATLQWTQHLHLYHCYGTETSVHELCTKGFKDLKYLQVDDSPSIYYIVRSSEWLAGSAFTILESLCLKNLVNLERICHGLLRKDSFTRLREVTVHGCNKLKNLFCLSLARGLCELEKIKVIDCNTMEEVIIAERKEEDDEDEVGEGETTNCAIVGKSSLVTRLVSAKNLIACGSNTKKAVKDDDTLHLPRLRFLTLQSLPNITNFLAKENSLDSVSTRKPQSDPTSFFETQQVSLPYLESLTLIKLAKLIKIGQIHDSLKLSKLQSLEVRECKYLLKAVDSSLLVNLGSLETLSISECKSIVEVFDLQGPEVPGGNAEILPQLRTLELVELENVRYVWTKSPKGIRGFQNLMSLNVTYCSDMRFLFPWSIAKAMEKLEEIEIDSCKKMEAVVALEEGGKAEDVIELPALKVLSVRNCRKMKSFLISAYREPEEMETEPEEMETAQSLKKLLCCGKQDRSPSEDTDDAAVFFNEKVLLPSLEKLRLSDIGPVKKIWQSKLPKISFCQLESLTLFSCKNLSMVFPPTMTRRLDKLKEMEFSYCDSLEMLFEPEFVDSDKKLKRVSLPQLKEVRLTKNIKLKHVVASDSNLAVGLPSLTKIQVGECGELMDLFPTTTATSLSKLEQVDIWDCGNMKELIVKKESEGVYINEMKFPCLRSLKLSGLDNLICFCSASCTFNFPSLANVLIEKCPVMEAFIPKPMFDSSAGNAPAFFNEKVQLPNIVQLAIEETGLKELWHNNVPAWSCWKLRDLRVRRCADLLQVIPPIMNSPSSFSIRNLTLLEVLGGKLRCLFTTSQASCLEQLQRLVVKESETMEHVIEQGNYREDGSFFPRLTSLTLSDLSVLSSFYEERHTPGSPFSGALFSVDKVSLPCLKELYIACLKQLKHIWKGEMKGKDYSQNLECLCVFECDELRHVVPASLAKGLLKLDKLEVYDCKLLEVVVTQGEGEGDSDRADIPKTVFPRLGSLTLSGLPELKSFIYPGAHISSWPLLKELTVRGCGAPVLASDFGTFSAISCDQSGSTTGLPLFLVDEISFPSLEKLQIRHFSELQEIWHGHVTADSFRKIMVIRVEECRELVTMFPPKVVHAFRKLENLILVNCRALTVIYDMEGLSADMDSDSGIGSTTAQLKELYLDSLEMLNQIWSRDPKGVLSFPKLHSVEVGGCERLRYLFPTSVAKALVQLEKLEVAYSGVENIVAAEDEEAEQEFVFPRLTLLELTELRVMKNFFPGPHTTRWPCLEELKVTHCNCIETLFGSALCKSSSSHQPFFSVKKEAFPRLEKTEISYLKNLRVLWDSQLEEDDFRELKKIVVRGCHELMTLFPTTMVLSNLEGLEISYCNSLRQLFSREPREIVNFQNLNSIKVEDCPSLEYLLPASVAKSLSQLNALTVDKAGIKVVIAGDEVVEESGTAKFVFPLVSELDLLSLPHLESFYPRKHTSRWPLLMHLTIKECGSVKSFALDSETSQGILEEDSPGEQPLFWADQYTFPSLETVGVHECHKLKTLFTSATAKSLVRLTIMSIEKCDELKEVVAAGGNSNGRDKISFDKLKKLDLKTLMRISHFCSGDYGLKFPSLEVLTVSGCPSFSVFSQGDLSAPKLDIVWTGIYEDDWIWESDLNGSIRQIHSDKEGLVAIERLKLSKSPEWKELWLDNHPPRFFTELTELIVEDCEILSTAVISSDQLPILGKLELLEIRNCGAVERVFDSPQEVTDDQLQPSDSPLGTIYLSSLPRLRLVIPDDLPQVFRFERLETIVIENCSSLRTVLSPTTALGLPGLQEIKISNCELLEEVISGEDGDDQNSIRFEDLRSITLESLPMLAGFYPGGCLLDCPDLKAMTIRDCPKMKTFTSPLLVKRSLNIDYEEEEEEERSSGGSSKLKDDVQVHKEPFFNEKVLFPTLEALIFSHMDSLSIVWHDQLPEGSFDELRSMKIEHCAKLQEVFPPKSLERFTLLETLCISHCASLEEVFDLSEMGVTGEGGSRGPEQGGDGEIIEEEEESKDDIGGDVTTAISLRELSLSHLLELKSICNVETKGIISIKVLKPVRVTECPKLENFGGFSVVTE